MRKYGLVMLRRKVISPLDTESPHRPRLPYISHSRLDALFPYLLLLAVAGSFWLWDHTTYHTSDSLRYLTFHPTRTAAYPLFLDAVAAFFGTVEVVGQIQLVLAAIALVFFGFAMRRAFNAPLMALILVAFFSNWPHLTLQHSHIMTESLFVSCIYVLLASLMLLLRRPSWSTAASASLACGLAITLRPAGVMLAPLLVVALWLIWHQCAGKRKAIAVALILPVALCLGGESALWKAHHNQHYRPNLANKHLFAKALLIAPASTVADAELAHVIAHGREVMALGRELIENAPSLQAKIYLLSQFEQTAQNATYVRAIAPLVHSVAIARGQTDIDLRGEAGREVLMSEPASWLGNALTHYWGMWSSFWILRPQFVASCQAYMEDVADSQLVADTRALKRLIARGSVRHLGLPKVWFDEVFYWLMLASFAASFLAIGLALWQRFSRGVADRELALAALCGLAVHAHFLLCGFVGIATHRYAIVMLPMVAVCGALLTSWALREIRWRALMLFVPTAMAVYVRRLTTARKARA